MDSASALPLTRRHVLHGAVLAGLAAVPDPWRFVTSAADAGCAPPAGHHQAPGRCRCGRSRRRTRPVWRFAGHRAGTPPGEGVRPHRHPRSREPDRGRALAIDAHGTGVPAIGEQPVPGDMYGQRVRGARPSCGHPAGRGRVHRVLPGAAVRVCGGGPVPRQRPGGDPRHGAGPPQSARPGPRPSPRSASVRTVPSGT